MEPGGAPSAPPRIDLVRELGRGAEGVTYEGVRDGERVACKRLDVDVDAARVAEELRALAAAREPGLCVPHDAVRTDDRALWLVMPLVTGDDFVAHARRDALPRAAGAPALPMAFG